MILIGLRHLLNAFVDRLGEVMTESNILPYDGQAILIDDHGAEFDWPAITRMLIDTIPWQVETARIFGREMPIPRMTAWFGDGAYSYSGIVHLPAPFPAIIERLRQRAEALSGALFNAALANFYRSGRDSVGWHSDNEAGLGNRPIIASLSLGGERRFQFRHRETTQTITLGLRMGHWLIMAGETQRFWVHQVPKAAAPAAPRVNLSFRLMIP
jgi:alkylated DNA repair dioxygenase AlkB